MSETEKSAIRAEFDTMNDDQLTKVKKDIDYLHTIIFAVCEKDIVSMQRDIDFTTDELQSAFLDIREADRFTRLTDGEMAVKLFADAVKAVKRSIDYASSTRVARKMQTQREKYDRWAEQHPELAADPLHDLSLRFSLGLLSEELYTKLMAKAQENVQKLRSAASAAL